MNKPTVNSALEQTSRLLDLVPYLAAHQGIAIDQLASVFSISTAQLTEDLTTLWMCGLPGYTPLELMDLSFDGGFVSISNAETLARPRTLNRDEILALVLGLEVLLKDAESNELSMTVSRLIAKLVDFLDSNVNQKVAAGTSAASRERGALEKAIESRSAVPIRYHSATRDEVSERVIQPLEISRYNEGEYVLAFCELTDAYRTFRLDRIIAIGDLEARAGGIRSQVLEEESVSARIDAVVTSRLRDVVERFTVTALDTRSPNVVLEIFSVDWAVREIMSFGGEITVLGPETVRKALRERATRALEAYKE